MNRIETSFDNSMDYLCFFSYSSKKDYETQETHSLAIAPDPIVADHGVFYYFSDINGMHIFKLSIKLNDYEKIFTL